MSSWAYDAVGRLASITQDLAGTADDLTVTSSYNPASQIVSQARSNDAYAWTGAANVVRGYTSNGLNQYTAAGSASFTHDANGNLTSDGTSSFTYDAENKLTSTSVSSVTSTLGYDPLNRLDTYNPGAAVRFIYDGNEAVGKLNSAGTIIGRFVRGDGADELLVSYPDAGTSNRRWAHLDERNSVLALTDGSGVATTKNRYDEYGVPQTTNPTLFQYTGQMWLAQSGVQYSKARTYSPTLGRFLQTDPIGPADSPNIYQYALSDPVNLVDPLGFGCNDIPVINGSGAIYVTGHCPSNLLGGGNGGGPRWQRLQLDVPIENSDGGEGAFGGPGQPTPPPPPPAPQPPKKSFCHPNSSSKLGAIADIAGNLSEVTGDLALGSLALGAVTSETGVGGNNLWWARRRSWSGVSCKWRRRCPRELLQWRHAECYFYRDRRRSGCHCYACLGQGSEGD